MLIFPVKKILMVMVFIMTLMLLLMDASEAKEKVSVELQQTNLVDAIRLMAKFLQLNVIISPTVNGMVTLHLHEMLPAQAFDVLLRTHGLAKWKMGNVWLIGTREEFIQTQQEELKWQAISEEMLPLEVHSWQLRFAHVEDLLPLLKDEQHALMSKRGHIQVDARTNKIIVYDIPAHINLLKQLVQAIDVPVKQLLIAVRLISVDHEVERELGIHFEMTEQISTDRDMISKQSMGRVIGHYSLALAKLADSASLDVKLAALESTGHAELISSPTLFTGDQQSASIETGEELPYQEVSDSGGTAVSFKKAVLALRVKPHILPGNQVLLQLQINQDRPGNRVIQGVPSISTRQIMTNVLIKNRHTIVLGGIYETSETSGQKGLPFLSKIPVLGWLFQQRLQQGNKRELLIFVTPIIV